VPKTPEKLPDNVSAQPLNEGHKRRPRYPGKYPRRFEQRYKEHNPERFPETFRKVIESGKTPAGTHRSVMLDQVLELLAPRPGDLLVDCTLGYGGHALAFLPRILPGGRLIGLDQDPIELPKTEARFRSAGFGPQVFTACQTNFAGIAQVLSRFNLAGADMILTDLGVSSMQLDDPKRGFSLKFAGQLDMRMNPHKGRPASALLQTITPCALAELLELNADEPFAELLGNALAGHCFETTGHLATRIRSVVPRSSPEEVELSVRRTFQALRIAVNDEFSALEALLRQVPECLKAGGRVAVISFHSGEDRRVKKAFASGLRAGVYAEIATEVIRPTPVERHANPRSVPAKLRWARRRP
jgi:16S rRNA (cytosine1402-N4)-methyltransferase